MIERKQMGIRLVLILLITCFLSSCIMEYPPPDEISLINIMPATRSSFKPFSYDLTSPLLRPFFTRPGQDMPISSVVNKQHGVTLSLPLPGMVPAALALEARTFESVGGRSDMQIYLNGENLGLMIVKPTLRRKTLIIDEDSWNPIINELRFETVHPDIHIQVSNLWLLPDPNGDLSALKPGNHFTGYVIVPGEAESVDAIYIPAQSHISFPVQIPEPAGFLSARVRLATQGHTHLDFALITARAFTTETPLNFSFPVSGNSKEWAPLEWNLSERAGRHGILRVTNAGSQGVFFGEPELVARATRVFTAAVTKPL